MIKMLPDLTSDRYILLSALGILTTLLITINGFPVDDASVASHLLLGLLLAQIGFRIKKGSVIFVLMFVFLLSIAWEALEATGIPQTFIPNLQSNENIYSKVFDIGMNFLGALSLMMYKRKFLKNMVM